MTELVANCPRCRARKMTFDLLSVITIRKEYGWQLWYEAFCVCRKCRRATIFILSDDVNSDYDFLHETGLLNIEVAANRFVNIEGHISLKDTASMPPPKHLPESVEAIYREGATCIAVKCYNAAGTMFRLCIDLSTRELLPREHAEGLNARTRRDLGLRLPWLLKSGLLPQSLQHLSSCVREDGNDGAHAGTLTTEDAHDLAEFSYVLLERLYTEPEKLRLAEGRREKRRQTSE